jgi:glycoside/pentoside/hexuronide:cation symporter, GPH family
VLHQAWGARLGGDEAQRARIVSWREGLALVGVLVASVLPSVAGLSVTTRCSPCCWLAAWRCWRARRGPRLRRAAAPPASARPGEPLRTPAFRRLLADLPRQRRGQRGAGHAGAVLHPRPAAGPGLRAAVPGQLLRRRRAVDAAVGARWWRASAWRAAGWPAWCWRSPPSPGPRCWARATWPAYTAVCMASGIALGADLALPGALLAGVIQRAGHGQRLEGGYFGWWNFATKLNLALAAGVALPLLGAVRLRARQPDPRRCRR